ncbi:hypothetical protein H1W37_18225 [Stappia taiwanensis]|uniref:Uncharacterized protein n=1 Tax=Stappia taiwanensis TaxID=992267 RepID=A0A838XQS1_9HYPH|nr:hypothetical protein [Stappia taiwanensis]MBA4613599.1 hypothetical protein [Stappia taiwanensis]GGE98881.1 hypothetical protein GCM10007285_28040 [Stappia taiwanensis]
MSWPLHLRVLVRLQWVFAALAVGFLIASAARAAIVGAPLSAANIPASIGLFVLYAASLFLPRAGRLGWYRLAMIPALVFFGGGGVIANVLRYAENGLESYASVTAFVIAVGINAFGTILNLIAALGLFRKDGSP